MVGLVLGVYVLPDLLVNGVLQACATTVDHLALTPFTHHFPTGSLGLAPDSQLSGLGCLALLVGPNVLHVVELAVLECHSLILRVHSIE